MKAIVQDTYGSADALELREIEDPVIGEDDVLVRVQGAGVDPGVRLLMTGIPYVLRLGYGLRKPRVRVRGRDVAGRVEAVGPAVTGFESGDEVMGTCEGSFAEYAVARTERLVPKPAALTFEQAAACPISGLAALQAVRDAGRIQTGQHVLIVGASGGVGTFAVQLAKSFGAEVTGVCSTSKMDLVRSIGADEVIDYTREDFTDGSRRWDLIVDTAGRHRLLHLRRSLTAKGTLVVGDEAGGRWFGLAGRLLRAQLLNTFVGQTVRALASKERQPDLQLLVELIEAGKVTPTIDRTFPLADAPKAIRYLAEGHPGGKVVVTV